MEPIKIRGLRSSDGNALGELYGLPNVVRGTLQIPYAKEHIWQERASQPTPGIHHLIACSGERVVGHLGLHLHQNPRRRHSASLGMGVRDDCQRRGAGGALLDAALELCDGWYGVQRIELDVFVDNEAAYGLYVSRGFKVEGVQRGYGFRDGALVDTYVMGRVRIPEGQRRVEAPAGAK